jgi:lipopolysaccharide transport system permease protein
MGDRWKRPRMVIRPGMGPLHYWKDLWRYRELFFFLAWRDILVRYKQTTIGISWSVIRPLVTMLAFTLVFDRLAKLPSNGVPYPVMIFSALLPWQFFSSSFSEGSNSLVDNAGLLTKIYFPRMIVPASTLIVALVDFLISLLILFGIIAWYRMGLSLQFLFLPLFFVFAIATSMGVSFWLSALTVKYRDFRHAVPFLAQVGLYVSPVGFSSAIVPMKWRFLYYLNPMAGVIDGFRWSILGDAFPLYLPGLMVSIGIASMLLFGGMVHFRRVERSFADVV